MLKNVDYIINSTKKLTEYISSIKKHICFDSININSLLAKTMSNIATISNYYTSSIAKIFSSFNNTILESLTNPHSYFSYSSYENDLKKFHWALPYCITIEELHSILTKVNNEVEFDSEMLKVYSNEKIYFMIDKILALIPSHHKVIMKQIKSIVPTKNYALINNALLSIIDNCLSIYLYDKGCNTRTNILKPIIDIYEDIDINQIELFVFELMMLSNNINFIYEVVDFNSNKKIKGNKQVRRHAALHGVKYSNKRIDSIMLLNTLISLLNIRHHLKHFECGIIYNKNKKFSLNEKAKKYADYIRIKSIIDSMISYDGYLEYDELMNNLISFNIILNKDKINSKKISAILQRMRKKGYIEYENGKWIYSNIQNNK